MQTVSVNIYRVPAIMYHNYKLNKKSCGSAVTRFFLFHVMQNVCYTILFYLLCVILQQVSSKKPVRRLLGDQRTGAKEPNELFSL